jgi:uncharacterized membrane protein YkvA (DUF1232 family)
MGVWLWPAVAGGVLVAAVLAVSAALLTSNRRDEARALAGFVPDLAILSFRLLRDPRIRWWRKGLLALLAAYLATPIDLVPGSPLDDALLAAIILPIVLRGSRELVEEHWPGPRSSLVRVQRLAGPPPRGDA